VSVPHWIIVAAASETTDSNPFQAFQDFFSSAAWQFIVYLFFFCIAVIWLAGAFWVFKDARRRIDDPIVIGVCVATALVFGPIGWIVYAIARPSEYLSDRRVRELDMQVMEQRLNDSRCAYCGSPVREDYLVCPSCGGRLRTQCRSCRRPLAPTWRVCPYCETDTHPAAYGQDRF
jgi:RNA polymerase subunit RPABC4/transcription elongation factor Spt4